MIETIFTLEDEPMTPGTEAPEEDGAEEAEETPASEPESLLEDEAGEEESAE
jgi:hypothetical protein